MAYLHCIPPVDDTFVDKTPQGNFSFRSVICTNMTIFPAAVLSAQCRGGGLDSLISDKAGGGRNILVATARLAFMRFLYVEVGKI